MGVTPGFPFLEFRFKVKKSMNKGSSQARPILIEGERGQVHLDAGKMPGLVPLTFNECSPEQHQKKQVQHSPKSIKPNHLPSQNRSKAKWLKSLDAVSIYFVIRWKSGG